MGTTSRSMILLVLVMSTCCLALPRRGSDDFPKPVLPKSLKEAGAQDIINAGEDAATRSIETPAIPEITPLLGYPLSSPSLLDSVKKAIKAITLFKKLNAPFDVGSGDNSLMKKIGDYLESFRIIKRVDDGCSDDKKKDDLSCTTINVHGFYDLFGQAWHKLTKTYEKWVTPVIERVIEIKEDKKDAKDTSPGGTTIVTKPNTYFANFIKFLYMFGLDGSPEVVYDKEKEEEEKKKQEEQKKNEKTLQQIKEDALLAGDFHLIKRVEKHNYWAKSVNALIKLAGLGVFGALCAQNCGIDNLLGFGTPPETLLPPLTPEQEAANLDAALADAAGDTDGDGDVDYDDGRRHDSIVDDSYQGYDHYGEYVGYDLQQPQVQSEQKNHVKDGRDPGYAYGTHPGWYPPAANINTNNNNNHLVEPAHHPDFSNRQLFLRHLPAYPIQEEDMDDDSSVVVQAQPQPVYRGGRMLVDPTEEEVVKTIVQRRP